MKFLFVLALLYGCQDYNSNSYDKDRYGEIELTGSPQFKAAYPVLQSRCMNCHRHAQWSAYTNQQDWVTNENLVIAGDSQNSQLVYRIINSGSANSDMPQGGSALPTAEYNSIVDWVDNGF